VTLADWAEQHDMMLEFIKPGRPMQNGFIERFNRSYREAARHVCVSKLGGSATAKLSNALKSTTKNAPHESLGHLTPREYC